MKIPGDSNLRFIKFECQYCHGPLEAPMEIQFQEIDCPHCGKKIRVVEPPKPESQYTDEERQATLKHQWSQAIHAKANDLESTAEYFLVISSLSLFGLILVIIISIALALNDSTEGAIIAAGVAGGLLSIWLISTLTGHVIHIRALLHREKK